MTAARASVPPETPVGPRLPLHAPTGALTRPGGNAGHLLRSAPQATVRTVLGADAVRALARLRQHGMPQEGGCHARA
ncbi:hypothetical protein [Paracidovorax anthurii]|uniref:hypothetical protein n=1 Tax=Paracidovorax anthurii TaxID=78229 RepID=UPI0011BEF5F9|nr:hypothetical protein [Paracidovorax anthurii]